jgi:hypothetical protein
MSTSELLALRGAVPDLEYPEPLDAHDPD